MKRIYILGAALMLFLVIAIDHYSKSNSTPDIQKSAEAQLITSDKCAGQTCANSKEIVSAPVSEPENQPSASGITLRPTNKSRRTATRRVAASLVVAPAAKPARDMDELGTESTNYYYASNPPKPVAGKKQQRFVVVRKAKDKDMNEPCGKGLRPGLIGVEVGFNQNGLRDNSTSNMHTGSVHAGVMLNLRMGDHLAFQPSVLYINKGNRTASTMDVLTKEKLTMHYLEVPADLVVKFGDVKNARITAGAGPYVSYLLGAKDKYSSGTDGFSDLIDAGPVYKTADVRKMDWGFNGFLGCESPEGLFAKVGVDLGMRNIQKNTQGSSFNRNYSVLFTVGYVLGGYDR